MRKNDALFELTVENIPNRFIVPAKKDLRDKIVELLNNFRLGYDEIVVYATYRRFVVIIKGVMEKTAEIVEKIYGPSAKLLKDQNGNYTKAVIGFAKSCGVDVEDLKIEKHEKKGDVLCVYKKIPSKKATAILSDVFVSAVKSLNFPKNMIWEESKFVFARPIRNIVALYGNKVINLSIAGVRSSKITYSPYFNGFKKITIRNPNEYIKVMERNGVYIDDEKRKKMIFKIIEGVEGTVNCVVKKNEELINELVYLCEYPSGVVVKYPSEFLSLPKELLELVMRKQLKFFSCYNKKGEAISVFLGIRDGFSIGHKNVEEGYLNVFKARCNDALFFYNNDLKTDKKVFEDKLKNIIFQKELGTMYEKKLRVESIALEIAKRLGCINDDFRYALNYVYYDLVSSVVNEFPELEGIMNYYYAKNYGIQQESYKKAISEIYLPLGLQSPIPSNIYANIVALSHKIDTIVGDFILDIKPTGSNDPHGLRRMANGIFRIITESNLNLSVKDIVSIAYNCYPEKIKSRKKLEVLIQDICDFIYQRIESYCISKEITPDVVLSVKHIFMRYGDIINVVKRVQVISDMKGKDEFKNLSLLYKRLKNIIKDFDNDMVDEKLFEKDDERVLFEIYNDIYKKVLEKIKDANWQGAIMDIMEIYVPLDNFFKNVLVMVDDEKIKNNRLSLLKKIHTLFDDIGDISQIAY